MANSNRLQTTYSRLETVISIRYALVMILVSLILFTPVVCAEDWPMFQHDAAHTGATDDVVLPPLELVWNSGTGGSGSGSPSVVGDMLFAHDYLGGVYAVDAKTGNIKWKYDTGERIFVSSPTVSENIVYIGTEEYLYAIDATNGYFKWKYETGHTVGTAIVVDGNVYFSAGRDLYSIDATTSEDNWKCEGKVGSNEFSPHINVVT